MSKEHADAFECGYQMGLAHGRAEHEPIVRCRDCKHYGLGHRCGWSRRFVKPDGFCAWGEREVNQR